MGMEFKKPLIIGDIDASVKSDISQIKQDIGDLSQLETADKSSLVNALNEAIDSTLNGASRDLDNLSDEGNDKLRSLNAYANEGELLTDAEGLADVENYAHSTFNLSKFTVVGSPTITDDGIATSKDRVSYLASHNAIDLSNANSWEIKFRSTSGTNSLGYFPTPFSISTTDGNGIMIDSGKLYMSGGYGWDLASNVSIIPQDGVMYYMKLGFTGSQYYAERSTDGKNYTNVWTNNTTTKTNANTVVTLLNWIYDIAGRYFNGQFDLKQFSITVDGVEVFSGNRTGIDTVKPDDYTVVGTPTISADGIASGFSSSNYLTTSIITLSKPWKAEGTFIKDSGTSPIFAFGTNNRNYVLFRDDRTKLCIPELSIDVTEWTALQNNTAYYIKLSWDGSKYELKVYNLDGSIYLSISAESSTACANSMFQIGYSEWESEYIHGSIDLNTFKIYVDGNLVYQACLKIPYTESKTGSKIVDSVYRDRVSDMASQFGFANYYTLDEDNGNFTLPQVELYGLIGKRTLRDSYRNGINYWELYSNRDLEQGGSCTSGVEVTFARPFADTNYVLSVPYSAKSTTAFTPTQTGDWIAKGKGLL